jgi:hypothetical protein
MVEDEWDDWHDRELVDLDGGACDVTGDPALDVYGYQSPTRRGQNLTGFTSSHGDYGAASREGRERRRRQREAWRQRLDAERREREARRPESEQRPAHASVSPRASTTPARPQPAPGQPTVADPPQSQPGQHGAYFEVRTTRVWWAPWRRRQHWQQVSAWTHGQPPAGAAVVTVADVTALPGRVHTIGRLGQTGAVEY